MSPSQRYEFPIKLTNEEQLSKLIGSPLTVRHKRKLLWDYSTTTRIGESGLGAVSLEDRTSPAGMIASQLNRIANKSG